MSGPARAGLFIYAKDSERLARFYELVAKMNRLHARDDLIVLQSPDIQLLIHKIPAPIARNIVIHSPPTRRENVALKFFLTVPNLSEARSIASDQGGEILEETWRGPGLVACNAIDPEGNVFQVRETDD